MVIRKMADIVESLQFRLPARRQLVAGVVGNVVPFVPGALGLRPLVLLLSYLAFNFSYNDATFYLAV